MITGRTRVLGVIADPVVQAQTPAMANTLIGQLQLSEAFVLVPMHVPTTGFAPFLAGLRAWKNLAGAVVSMPHKIAATGLVDDLSHEATLIGALNVVRREPDGRLVGTLLDGEGFVAGRVAQGHSVAGKDVLLAGAGGAASAVAFAVVKHGCASLTIVNRSTDRLTQLVARLRAHFPDATIRTDIGGRTRYDLCVNGTSLGMRAGDSMPFTEAIVANAGLVAECVLAPEQTPMLLLAQRIGRPVHVGTHMLAGQMRRMLDFMQVV